jgi:hypothetical protein
LWRWRDKPRLMLSHPSFRCTKTPRKERMGQPWGGEEQSFPTLSQKGRERMGHGYL